MLFIKDLLVNVAGKTSLLKLDTVSGIVKELVIRQ